MQIFYCWGSAIYSSDGPEKIPAAGLPPPGKPVDRVWTGAAGGGWFPPPVAAAPAATAFCKPALVGPGALFQPPEKHPEDRRTPRWDGAERYHTSLVAGTAGIAGGASGQKYHHGIGKNPSGATVN